MLGYAVLLILGFKSNLFFYFIFIGIELLCRVVSFRCPASWPLRVFVYPLPLSLPPPGCHSAQVHGGPACAFQQPPAGDPGPAATE